MHVPLVEAHDSISKATFLSQFLKNGRWGENLITIYFLYEAK